MDDEKIIALFFAREEAAIQETDAAYGRKLYTLADRVLRCREDSQECVNDTYLNTWNAIPPRHPNRLFAFLASICRNLALNRLDWKQAARRNAQIVSLSEEMELCIPDSRRQQELENRELGQLLTAFLEELPKESRLIFLRRYWYVDTIAEIAVRYGMTESKVKMQLSRTRARLRTCLEKEGITV